MTLKPPLHKSVLSGIDNFFKETPQWFSDIQKQHALYSHLVPMYRTVHREKPRKLILRAIRWVNPKNFFPLMNLLEKGKGGAAKTLEALRDKSKEELEADFLQLNEYREESLVIGNRYDQMMALMAQGQLPYRIMWQEKKWMTLEERKERAVGLRKGTDNWERDIDGMAVLMNRVLKEKGGEMGEIEGLYDEGEGRIPFFLDRKKKKVDPETGEKVHPPLRRTRSTRGGEFEEEGRPEVIAEKAKPRAARFQIPSMLESLDPEIQAQRTVDAEMNAAPLYGFPDDYRNRRIGTGAMINASEINRIASEYSGGEDGLTEDGEAEHPLFGFWQENLGIDAATIRSSRFVAETENILAGLSSTATETNRAREAVSSRTEPAVTFSGDSVDISMDNLDLENAQVLSDLDPGAYFEGLAETGNLYRVPTKDGKSVLLRVPSGDDPDSVSANARLSFKLDRFLGLGSMPRVDRFMGTFQGRDIDSYLVEDLNGRGGIVNMFETEPSQIKELLTDNVDARQSLMALIVNDLMTGVQNSDAWGDNNNVRPVQGIGVDAGRGLFVATDTDGTFSRGDGIFGGYTETQDGTGSFRDVQNYAALDEGTIPDGIDWESESETFLNSIIDTDSTDFIQSIRDRADTSEGQAWSNFIGDLDDDEARRKIRRVKGALTEYIGELFTEGVDRGAE